MTTDRSLNSEFVSVKLFCMLLKQFNVLNLPQGMCYSHLGNGVRNGAISISQWGFISGCYKVKSIGQWVKNSGNGNGVCKSFGAL